MRTGQEKWYLLIIACFSFFAQQAISSQSQDKLLTIHFRTASYHLGNLDQQSLQEFAKRVSNTKNRYLLVGHTDERGGNQYNLKLGDERARSVLRYFIEAGLDADRFLILSKGEAEPIDPSHHSTAWKKNRRVEILIW